MNKKIIYISLFFITSFLTKEALPCSKTCPTGLKKVKFCDVKTVRTKAANGFKISTKKSTSPLSFRFNRKWGARKKSSCIKNFKAQMSMFKSDPSLCKGPKVIRPGVKTKFSFVQDSKCKCHRLLGQCGSIK